MVAGDITIGNLAKETGCKIPTIRYYEQIGIMPDPPRTGGNHRVYSREHVERLSFIRHSRELGLSLDQIRELLRMGGELDQSCEQVARIARAHLQGVERRITRLQALREKLQRTINQCAGGRIADCKIIEVLADHTHAHCLTGDHRKDI